MGVICEAHLEWMQVKRWIYYGPLHIEQNSHLFAALSGETNGKWGMQVGPISGPRGLPTDVTSQVKDASEESGEDAFGHSWVSAPELLNFDWHQQVQHRAWIDLTEPGVRDWYERGDRSTAPPSYAHAVGYGETPPSDRYLFVPWTQSLAIDVNRFLEGVLPYLTYVSAGEPERLRIVFWFLK